MISCDLRPEDAAQARTALVLLDAKIALGPVIKDHGFQLKRKGQRSKVKVQLLARGRTCSLSPFLRLLHTPLTPDLGYGKHVLSSSIRKVHIHNLLLQIIMLCSPINDCLEGPYFSTCINGL